MFSGVLHNPWLSVALITGGIWAYSSVYAGPLQNPHETDTPYPSLAFDQVVARPSLKQAPIAAVALAQINIALHKAWRTTEQSLCGGQWLPMGNRAVQYPGASKYSVMGKKDVSKGAWHFNLLRHPHSLSCGNVSRARFFVEMSRHLPEWRLPGLRGPQGPPSSGPFHE